MDKTLETRNLFILILCGGSGPRLWPLSRTKRPKQFLSLFDKSSLLEQTIKRALKIVPPENIFIVSNFKYAKTISKITKNKIPSKNILSEPEKKNTAMAITYAAAAIKKINKDAIIISLPSDHFIGKLDFFKKNIIDTCQLAEKNNSIITIGIKPTTPNPSFGYILPANSFGAYFQAKKFIEKPDSTEASVLISKGAFWNSGIYTFKVDTLVQEFKKNSREYYHIYENLVKGSLSKKIVNEAYKQSPDLAIDKAVSEKSDNIQMIPSEFDWNDVGEWRTIHIQSPKDTQGHAILNSVTKMVQVKSSNCLVHGQKNKLVGLVGVDNLAIIDTPDALLICNLADSFNVRDLVTLIVDNPKTKKYFLNHKNDQR